MFQADAAVWDGVFANNAWLQECPRPLTKEVWGNSLAFSPGDAARLGVRDGDVVTISHSAVVTPLFFFFFFFFFSSVALADGHDVAVAYAASPGDKARLLPKPPWSGASDILAAKSIVGENALPDRVIRWNTEAILALDR